MMKRHIVFLTLAAVTTLSLMTMMQSVAQRGGQNNNQNPDAQNPMTVTQGAPGRGGGNQNQDAPLPPGVKTTFVHLGQGEPAVLYEPINPGPKAQIVIVTMHSAGDELTT